MTAQEVMQQIAAQIGPKLDELGVEAFMMCAYVRTGDGQIHRMTLGGAAKNQENPAFVDGLKTVEAVMNRWGAGQL